MCTLVLLISFSGCSLNILSEQQSKSESKNESESEPETTFVDDRDGQEYSFVTIGEQIWMAENLNYAATESHCYRDSLSYCETYGRMYNWVTAMQLENKYSTEEWAGDRSKYQGVCPNGWFFPNNLDWHELFDFIDSDQNGTMLKAKSDVWPGTPGTDDYGFSALPGGGSENYAYATSEGSATAWWNSRETGGDFGDFTCMNSENESACGGIGIKSNYSYVRCLKVSE